MTDSMIERVGRAHADFAGCKYEPDKSFWDGTARAAIQAMREPTATMLDNGCADFPNAATPYRSDEYLPAAKQIYEAMIDAALEKVPA